MIKNKEISRFINYLEKFPNTEVWVMAKTINTGKSFWKSITSYLEYHNIKVSKKPIFISSRIEKIDGYNTFNAVILLCGKWYINPIAFSDAFRMYLENAKFTLPIGEMPYREPEESVHDSLLLTNDEIGNILSLANVAFDEGFGDEKEEKTIEKLENILKKRKAQ